MVEKEYKIESRNASTREAYRGCSMTKVTNIGSRRLVSDNLPKKNPGLKLMGADK